MHCIQKCQRTTQGSKKFPLVTVSVIDVHFKSLSNVKSKVEVTGCTDIEIFPMKKCLQVGYT